MSTTHLVKRLALSALAVLLIGVFASIVRAAKTAKPTILPPGSTAELGLTDDGTGKEGIGISREGDASDTGVRLFVVVGLLMVVGLICLVALLWDTWEPRVLGLIFVFVGTFLGAIVLLLWHIPKRQAASRRGDSQVTTKDLFDIENDARTTLAQVVGGLLLLFGLVVAGQQLAETWESLRLVEQGQLTERFTRATDQLGTMSSATRLGGIHALEQIGREPDYHWAVMEILTAFVREKAPWPEEWLTSEGPDATSATRFDAEVQAILTVIVRRDHSGETEDQRLDLRATDLRGASLVGSYLRFALFEGANLERANLWGADLRGADFTKTILDGADLSRARLEGARFVEARLGCVDSEDGSNGCTSLVSAHLEEATLTGADLQGANLSDAHLMDAILVEADLRGANVAGADLDEADLRRTRLEGVDLQRVRNLTQRQVHFACTDDGTKLPDGLVRNPNAPGCEPNAMDALGEGVPHTLTLRQPGKAR